MKHRNEDGRRRDRGRGGRDGNARDSNDGRARETPGERVARAYERGNEPRARREESRGRLEEPRARREERDVRRDEGRARDENSRVRRQNPHVERQNSRVERQTSLVERERSGVQRQRSDVRRDERDMRRQKPPVRREEVGVWREESPVRRDEGVGGAQTFAMRDEDAARRTRVEEDGAHVFGVQPVLEALRAGVRPVERLTLAEGAHESRLREILEIARYADIPVRRVPRSELQRLAAGANHQGVVATIAAAHYTHAEDLLDALSVRVGTNDPPLAVVLDGVEDPRNLGAVIRTTECAGAHGVFVPERRASGLTETVAKAAAGALEYVPVARAANVVRLLEELKGRGVWTVGTAADAAKDYTEWDWTQPSAILLGGEGGGLRWLVRERCDVLVRIPLLGRIESLNVSVAAAVILYEAVRQRRAKKVMNAE
jgi:23S rRNA (guanosine2251-2'-O)-methyltransferase